MQVLMIYGLMDKM